MSEEQMNFIIFEMAFKHYLHLHIYVTYIIKCDNLSTILFFSATNIVIILCRYLKYVYI